MILIDNINILKESYRGAYEILQAYEKSEEDIKFIVEDAKSGHKTLYYEDGNTKTYIHSKYNPKREMEAILSSHEDLKDGDSLIFYGTGLGYHIEDILNKYPNSRFYIYEPMPNLMNSFLSNINLKKHYKNRFLGMTIGKFNIGNNLSKFIDLDKKNIKIIELPSHINNFKDEFENFKESLKSVVESKSDSMRTDYVFQNRWILNSMKNFNTVLNTPNILKEREGYFKGKTAIIVAAGPSLNHEIENLKYIKENKMAYIFSVGSAINTLIEKDLYPDVTFSYDPSEKNQMVLELLKERNITEIPLIYGSSIGYEAIENYPGKIYNVITSQDAVSNYYLQEDLEDQVALVQDASSIAIITIQILKDLGFSEIVLVGQNLAYVGNKNHSDGVSYSKDISEEELKNALVVKDVYGNDVYTNSGYNSMRKQIEYYIEKFSDIKFYNTTKSGAHIEGSEFKELKDLMKSFEKDMVDNSWLELENTKYKLDRLDFYRRKMLREYKNAKKINNEYNKVLNKIERLVVNKNFDGLETMYVKLDRQLKKLENNDFYKTFIIPMNRVEYKLLADNVDNLNAIIDPYKKGSDIYKEFKIFLVLCMNTIEKVEEDFLKMDKSIEEYIEKNKKVGD